MVTSNDQPPSPSTCTRRAMGRGSELESELGSGLRILRFSIVAASISADDYCRDYVIPNHLRLLRALSWPKGRGCSQQFVVNRSPAAKFLSNTNAQGAGFTVHGNAFGKIGS
jgi:hypothetical protein